MKCVYCDNKAVISRPARCKEHFITYFEKRVWDTIDRFELIKKGQSICVAASGGKDSLALLDVLSKKYKLTALCVDEGIPGYRDRTIKDLELFCKRKNILLRIITFEDAGSRPLHELKPTHPCSTCGVLRRKALLEHTRGYDLIATGHNLDDEAQSIMMNVLRNQRVLMGRIGPKTPKREGIAVRIKPFYLTPEKEVRAYCLIKQIRTNFSECPNIVKSFRWQVGEALNYLEEEQPGSKRSIIDVFLKKHYRGIDKLHPEESCTHNKS